MSNQMNSGNNKQGDSNVYPYYYGNYNASQQEISQHTPGQPYWNYSSTGYDYDQFTEYSHNNSPKTISWGVRPSMCPLEKSHFVRGQVRRNTKHILAINNRNLLYCTNLDRSLLNRDHPGFWRVARHTYL